MMPASDSTPFVVGDDDGVFVERIGLAVERDKTFAGAGTAHMQIALDLARIEDMQRPGAVDRQEIGDVDERIDRPQADGAQLLLQPFGAWPVLDAAHEAQGEGRREMCVGRIEIEAHLHRAWELARQPA